jgi:hypothetical protein
LAVFAAGSLSLCLAGGGLLDGRPAASADVGPCALFPANNVWNTRVDWLPVAPRSDAYINSIGRNTGLHPDFGAGEPGTQPEVEIIFTAYGYQSDPGPYPIPPNPPIEGGPDSHGDRHVLVVQTGDCVLYELYHAVPQADGSWEADSGAVYDLNSHELRPAGWTSADAAGLPILPGLARYDEVAAGQIRHALRFTADYTQKKYIWPARHYASDITNPNVPPMGQRFRLKASFDVSGYSAQTRVILTALKVYGLILADNGGDWYLSGAPDPGWDDETLVDELRTVTGDDFEAVDESGLMIDLDSGQARQPYSTFVPLAIR